MVILIGIGSLFALATLAAIVSRLDTARAADRRFRAVLRRESWERRQQYHVAGPSWGDEDSD